MIPVETGNKQGEPSDCPSVLLGESFQATRLGGEIQSEPRWSWKSVETKGSEFTGQRIREESCRENPRDLGKVSLKQAAEY